MKYEAILYDMDGVVIDTHRCAYSVLSESAKSFGVEIPSNEIMKLGSLSGKQFWTYIKKKYGLSISIEELLGSYDVEKEMSFYDEIGLISNIEVTLQTLLENGYKLGLVTSGESIRVNKILTLFRNKNLFHVIVTADDVAEHKPSPACYLKALNKPGIGAQDALVVEDSSNGALAAKSAGCDVVGYKGSMWKHDSFSANNYIRNHKELLSKVLKVTWQACEPQPEFLPCGRWTWTQSRRL